LYKNLLEIYKKWLKIGRFVYASKEEEPYTNEFL
jgi:hypothetical protein